MRVVVLGGVSDVRVSINSLAHRWCGVMSSCGNDKCNMDKLCHSVDGKEGMLCVAL